MSVCVERQMGPGREEGEEKLNTEYNLTTSRNIGCGKRNEFSDIYKGSSKKPDYK